MADKKAPSRIQAGGLSFEEIRDAVVKYSGGNKSLVESVLADERVSEEALADSLATYTRFPRVNLATATIDPEAVKLLPPDLARKNLCIPLRVEGRTMTVAMANPTDYGAMQEIEFTVGKTLQVLVCTRTEITDAIKRFYEPDDALRALTENLEDTRSFEILAEGSDAAVDLSESRSQAELPPVIKVVNLMIQDAITQRATDIHIEPTLNDVQVRVRVDGVLRSLMQLPKWLANPVTTRVKVLARLDIAERRLPQDGRMKVQREQKSYDLRISTLPTMFGEKVVLRILSSGRELPTLEGVNLEPADLRTLTRAMNQPQGMILVTGPTGSGKSTTLYACLGHRKSPEVNIVTVEDPVEYQMQGLNQVQVNVKAGLTFAHCLRSILRQDPDLILVGEMRDLETTEIAFHAAMTGHLVLSTVHTNSAISTITRLLDLGVDPVLISSSISLITAQRLLRKLCDECKQVYQPPANLLNRLGREAVLGPDVKYYKEVGCARCGGTGFSGRMAVHELLPMNNTLRELIARKASEYEIQQAVRAQGMKFLLERGLERVREGSTAISELLRVIQLDEAEGVSGAQRCPGCNSVVEEDFSVCPNCLTSLKVLCARCNQQLKPDWKICPYCRTPVLEEVHTVGMLPAGMMGNEAPAEIFPDRAAALMSADFPEADGDTPAAVATPAPPLEQLESQKNVAADQSAKTKKSTILIVDDDPSIRIIVEKALRQLPFDIRTELACDGLQAIEMAERDHPDLIVLDMMMPGMDGLQVLQKLRSQVETTFIPIMMLTASPNDEGRSQAYLAGVDDYVSKPFNVPELNARVSRLLRRAYGLS